MRLWHSNNFFSLIFVVECNEVQICIFKSCIRMFRIGWRHEGQCALCFSYKWTNQFHFPENLLQVWRKSSLLPALHSWDSLYSQSRLPCPSGEDFIFGCGFQPGLLVINQKHIFYVVLIYIYLMLKVICDHLSVFQHMESGNNRFQHHAVKRDCVFTRHNVVYWVLIITN